MPKSRRKRRNRWLLMLVVFMVLAFSCALAPNLGLIHPQEEPATRKDQPLRELVRDAVAPEIEAAQRHRDFFSYEVDRETHDGLRTYLVAETEGVDVECLLQKDGEPLQADDRSAELAWLQRLRANDEDRKKLARRQRDEMNRRLTLMRALPDAFLFAEDTSSEDRTVRKIDFQPDPAFHPTSREAKVYGAMTGSIWLDAGTHRIRRAEGTLLHSVNFAWGFGAHLERGGTFLIEQEPLAGGSWRISHMELHFTGHKFLFGSLNIQRNERSRAFERIAAVPSVDEAILLLQTKLQSAGEMSRR